MKGVRFLRVQFPSPATVAPTEPKGTLRAVLGFLERVCEVRWILPTPLGVYIDINADFAE